MERDRPVTSGLTARVTGVLALLAVPLLAIGVGALVFALAEVPYAILRGDELTRSRFAFEAQPGAYVRIDWVAHVLTVVAIVLSAWVLASAGRWLGGHFPLRFGRRRGPAAIAAIALPPVVVAAGSAMLWLGALAGAVRVRTVVGSPGPTVVIAAVVWLALITLAGWWVTRQRRSWPQIALAAVAVSGAAVTAAAVRSAYAAGLGPGTAPAWFPLSLLSPDGWAPPDQPLPPLMAVSSQLFDGSVLALLCSCFLLAYLSSAALVLGSPDGARPTPWPHAGAARA